ncbi:hypothetical protein SAY86_028940 [Trapa natans]|uniref:F-box domain-containing protein n=1 Tax=Trapa natans TaxID=22666 RepID=A0AAN7M1G1_TRANT|nr:hypothetical protein SAY86_028940 [Trapa natans]
MDNQKARLLSEEIILEILARLPAKSLFRAKAVCKLWNKLIFQEYFVKLFNGLSIRNPMVLMEVSYSSKSTDSIWLYVDNHAATRLSLDFLNERVRVRASSNGLLCCSSKQYKDKYFVCNPVTREYIELPTRIENPFTTFYPPREATLVGLVNDLSESKFSVVLAGYQKTSRDVFDESFLCSVFDSESGRWREFVSVQNDEFSHINKNQVVFINGAFHWLTRNQQELLVLDLNNNHWRKMTLPNEVGKGHIISVYLLECDGFLSVIQMSKKFMKIWLLKNFDREEHWDMVDEVNLARIRSIVPIIFPITQNARLLPEEVIVQILVRLPVKSLLRAKSVCKLWNKLISEKYFVHIYNGFCGRNPMVITEVSSWSKPTDTNWIRVDNHEASPLSLDFLKEWRNFVSKQKDEFSHINKNQAVFINGAFHWLTQNYDVLVFVLKKNLWRKMTLPRHVGKGHMISIYLLECDGFLSVIQMSKEWMKIWLLKDYNKPDNWDLVDEVNLTNIRSTVPAIFPISQYGNCLLLASGKKILMYQKKSKEWKIIYSLNMEPTTPLWCSAFPFQITVSSCKKI